MRPGGVVTSPGGRVPAAGQAGTLPCVAGRAATHLDRRRRLVPRDYLERPWSFGSPGPVRWRVPAGGDGVSLLVAQVQHRLVAAWAVRRRPGDARVLCGRYGTSKQVVSRVVLGQRWAGETMLAALVDALAAPPTGTATG